MSRRISRRVCSVCALSACLLKVFVAVCCSVLQRVVLCQRVSVLQCVAVCCSVLQCVVLCQRVSVCQPSRLRVPCPRASACVCVECVVLSVCVLKVCVAVCCRVVQCVAGCGVVLQCECASSLARGCRVHAHPRACALRVCVECMCCSALQCASACVCVECVHCSVLQRVALRCYMLQCECVTTRISVCVC